MSALALERWDEIDPVLTRALDTPPDRREAVVAEVCGGDSVLRELVLDLLAADGACDGFLEHSAGRFAAGLFEELEQEGVLPRDVPAAAREGHIGPYRILEEIGAGGMSRVYLAERDDGAFQQKVALKITRALGAQREERERRFRIERQLLATLDHPGIARILDGGTTSDHRQYLVMELVEGRPLDAYCLEHSLDLEARLALFLEVCDIVQFAHQRLVVHRDLKPANILVDRNGHPRLLDFGIAKLLAAPGDERIAPAQTRTGLLLMTPEYAAPEQLKGGTITTATDVYALGVILYELLTGERPYSLEGRSPSEIEQIVCGQPPKRPSSIGSWKPGERSRSWRHDVDVITHKALEKEPERRYGSVAELGDDLKRLLAGYPVQARPASRRYRAARFIHRHRWGAAAATAFSLLSIGSAVILGLQQSQTLAERNRAQLEADTTRQIAAFLQGLFEASDPSVALGEDVRARELLESGRRQIAAMDGQPLVQAELALTLGQVHQSLASYEHADTLFALAAERRLAALGSSHPDTAESWIALGDLRRIRGDFAAAADLLGRALQVVSQLEGAEARLRVEALAALGRLARDEGRLQGAREVFFEALSLERSLGRGAEPHAGDLLTDLARVEQDLGDLDASGVSQRAALAIWQDLYPTGHPRVANALNNLGLLGSRSGDYAAAESYYRQAMAMWDRIVEPGHPDRVGTLSNLGVVLDKAGRYEDAYEAKATVLELDRQVFGESHPYVAMSLSNLAITVENLGDLDQAEALKREALAMREELLGPEHPELATSLNILAVLLERRGKLEEAEALHRRALAIRRTAFGEAHPMVAESLHNLGRTLWKKGDILQAEELLRAALAMDRATQGDSHPHVATTMTTLGAMLSQLGRRDEAGILLEQGLELRRRVLGGRHPDIAFSQLALAEHAARGGDEESAENFQAQAIALRREVLGDSHPLTLDASEPLAR